MSVKSRRRLLSLIALLLTGWVVWDVSQPDLAAPKGNDRSALSLKRAVNTQQTTVAPTFSGDLRFPARQAESSPVHDLFDLPKPPAPAPVPMMAASVPAAPVTPPLPYVYLGRYDDGGKKQVFLAQGNTTVVVGAGSKLAAGWKLESIDSGNLIFVYEPLGQKQSLPVREY